MNPRENIFYAPVYQSTPTIRELMTVEEKKVDDEKIYVKKDVVKVVFDILHTQQERMEELESTNKILYYTLMFIGLIIFLSILLKKPSDKIYLFNDGQVSR